MKSISPAAIAVILAFLVTAPAVAADPIVGKARIVTGDIIEINRQRIHLFGIAAPAPDQTCTARGARWSCGQNATFALSAIVERQWVHCARAPAAPAERITAVCRLAGANGPDIGAAMVRQGWALADRRVSAAYVREEDAARQAKAGLWVGEFVAPWDWRPRAPLNGGGTQ
jgi:endonuclease YncB( thermonuclease family)